MVCGLRPAGRHINGNAAMAPSRGANGEDRFCAPEFPLDSHARAVVRSIANRLLIVMPDPQDILFRSLADPTRRAIFERLCREGEQTVGALTARSGVSQPAVSKHLGVLRQAGLVRDRHEGRQTHYSAQLGALAPLIDWTSQMAGFWQSRFDHLEDLLKRMDQ
jgi:DNA-binding transcriptional ArsR family regulator